MSTVRIECVSLVTTDSKAEKKHFEDNAELIPQASIAAYYEAMHLTPEEHLAMLRKQQDKHEKYMALGDVILTNIRFYGSAVLNNVFDFPNMLRYRKRMKR